MSSMADAENVFEVNGMGSRQPRRIAQQMLSDILQPRAEEIIHFVRDEIRSAGYERQAGAGVVLTGGGAMLKGFAELAEEILDLSGPDRDGLEVLQAPCRAFAAACRDRSSQLFRFGVVWRSKAQDARLS